MNIIETHGIRKTFRSLTGKKKVEALRGVDITVKQGEIFGLLGPNGAGKTTLVKILLGICNKTDGDAFLFGEASRNARSRDRAGYLPESHKYPRYLKGMHVMDYYAKLSGMNKARREAEIPELLKMVRMEDWQTTKMGKYSKGMQQRVGLAAAMVSNPDLLVLDEPTDGVDPLGRKEIRDVLVEMKKRGKTIFLNSHFLSEVEMICDRVAVINKGEVVQQGTVAELTATSNSWTVTIDNKPADLAEQLGSAGANTKDLAGENMIIEVDSLADLNDILDAIRSKGQLISELRQQKRTLEDMFIDVITGEDGGSVQ